MRLRNVKGSREAISIDRYVIQEPEKHKGCWKKVFQNENPIHIEIGAGKGKFLIEHSKKNPNINYIAIEKFSSVLIRALQRVNEEEELNNIYFLRFDAEYINEIFDKDEIARIYLNFSDPWPKERHAKRRLTSKEFLKRYERCLMKSGELIFKTDNKDLFEFSLEEARNAGWEVSIATYDLHSSEFLDGNIMTEYEEKFVSEGKPINMLKAHQKR